MPCFLRNESLLVPDLVLILSSVEYINTCYLNQTQSNRISTAASCVPHPECATHDARSQALDACVFPFPGLEKVYLELKFLEVLEIPYQGTNAKREVLATDVVRRCYPTLRVSRVEAAVRLPNIFL